MTLPDTIRPISMAAALLLAISPMDAATAQSTPDSTQDLKLQRMPVVGGKDIQPRAGAAPTGPTDDEAKELLKETNDAGPIVPPHDLYGNPLGVDVQNGARDPARTLPPPSTPTPR